MTNKLVTIISLRKVVESLQEDQFMELISSICNECGFKFLRQIIFNGLQYTNEQIVEYNLKIIMKLTSNIVETQISSITNHQASNKLRLNDLSEIDITNICTYLDFDDLIQFELTDRYIFTQAHKSISCISLINKPNWFNKYLMFHHEKYNKTKHINLSRFNHIKYLSFILDDNHKRSIMYKAKEIARRNNWSYSVDEFKSYCRYIGISLQQLSKMKPVYFKFSLHFDWGINDIRSHFPFKQSWIKSLKHIHFFNMKWNHVLRFLELQFQGTSASQNIPLIAVTFENILWENSYLNDPKKYFGYFLYLLFSGFQFIINENSSDNDKNEIIDKSDYGKLYGYRAHSELNGKLVKILHFSNYDQKWKCKRVSPKIGYHGFINQYIFVEESHLKPIPQNAWNTMDNVHSKNANTINIEKFAFINMSLQNMERHDNIRSVRSHMFDILDDITIVNKYLSKSLRYLVFHHNGNDELFDHLIQSIITIRSSSLVSLHLQTIKHLKTNSIMFDVLPFQSFDKLRELCIESTENTSYLLQKIAESVIGFQRLHMCIKSGLCGDDQQSKMHKNSVESLLKAVFSEFNVHSLQLLSFEIVFEFDGMDYQSAASVDMKLNKLQTLYEILNSCINNKYVFDISNIPLKLKINLKYEIEIENSYFLHSKRDELIHKITKKLNYFPMLFYELCKLLLSIRNNVMILFKCSFSDKSMYINSNLSLMVNDIKKNNLFDKVYGWNRDMSNINEVFEFGIVAKTSDFIDSYRTKWLCCCSYCDDTEFFSS